MLSPFFDDVFVAFTHKFRPVTGAFSSALPRRILFLFGGDDLAPAGAVLGDFSRFSCPAAISALLSLVRDGDFRPSFYDGSDDFRPVPGALGARPTGVALPCTTSAVGEARRDFRPTGRRYNPRGRRGESEAKTGGVALQCAIGGAAFRGLPGPRRCAPVRAIRVLLDPDEARGRRDGRRALRAIREAQAGRGRSFASRSARETRARLRGPTGLEISC